MKMITLFQNLKRNTISFFSGLSLLSIMLFQTGNVNAQFTAGNLVVEQVGDGTTTLSGTSTTVKLLQFTLSGSVATGTSFFGSTSTPTTSPYNIVDSGTATSNGYISLSTDKAFVVVSGYNAPNATASIASSASATYGRTIGKVNYTGALQTNGTFNALSGNNYRSIASNGSVYYLAGNPGIVYTSTDITTGIATTCTSIGTANTRIVGIFNNTLFYSTGSSPVGISQLGTFGSLPTAAATATAIISVGGTSPSPYGFAFSPDGLTCYVADDRANTSGGVLKYTYAGGAFSNTTGWSGGTWTLAYTLGTGVANIGARGLTVDFSGTNPIIYGTSAEGSLNRVFKITDIGASSTASTLATATANYIFRGICFAPQAPATISVVESTIPNMSVSNSSRTINVSGSNLNGDISFAITGTNADRFSVLPTSLTQTSGTVSSTPVTVTYTNNGNVIDVATLTLSSPGATSVTFQLNAGLTTGISQLTQDLTVSSTNGKIQFSASAGETIEVYNSIGQKLVHKQAVEGQNSIPVSAKGVVLVKVGNRSAKVML